MMAEMVVSLFAHGREPLSIKRFSPAPGLGDG